MKTFITKYKTQIVAIITAISAAALSFTSLGGDIGKIAKIVIAVDAVIIAILKTGYDTAFVNNMVALLKLLQEQYGISPIANTKNIAGNIIILLK